MRPEADLRYAEERVEQRWHPEHEPKQEHRRERAGRQRFVVLANEKPTMLAAMVPVIESANATGHGQMSGAATMNTVPGTPNGWSTAYARTKAT